MEAATPISTSRRHLCRQAFTLVELVTVMLIMGIMAAVAAPRLLNALATSRVQSAARRVAADLRLAREHALRTSIAQIADFDVAMDRYAMPTVPNIDRPNSAYAVNLASSDFQVDLTTANFEGSNVIQFDIYGRANRAGSVVVRSGGLQRTVQVDRTGNISIL
jgi:prepilin-type N-terminal cleavage/methylation domain-containing protein